MKLWSDSQSALQSTFSLKPTSRMVDDTIKLLTSAKLLCQKELAWLRGHSGIMGNKVMDGMTKENAVAVQLPCPVLLRTEKEKKKKIRDLLRKTGSTYRKQFNSVELLNHSLRNPPHSTGYLLSG